MSIPRKRRSRGEATWSHSAPFLANPDLPSAIEQRRAQHRIATFYAGEEKGWHRLSGIGVRACPRKENKD
jgi:hypothetical protein